MIITLSGKGGTGKTTICALILDELARRGYDGTVLAVDGDPAPDPQTPRLEPSGRQRSPETPLRPVTASRCEHTRDSPQRASKGLDDQGRKDPAGKR